MRVGAFQNLELFDRDNDALRCGDMDHGKGARSKSGVGKIRDHTFDLSRADKCLGQVIADRQKYICDMESDCVSFMYQIPSRRLLIAAPVAVQHCTRLPKVTACSPTTAETERIGSQVSLFEQVASHHR